MATTIENIVAGAPATDADFRDYCTRINTNIPGFGPATSIYYAITNESGSTSTVQVDFTWLKLEA